MTRKSTQSTFRPRLLAVLTIATVIGCFNNESNRDADLVVDGGYLFGFTGRSDYNFVAVTFDSVTVVQLEAQLALPEEGRLMQLNGPLGRGDGGHNLDWNWHFLPGEWVLAEASIELCDGNPQYVSENLDTYIDTVGSYCPWGAHVLERLD